MKKLISGVIALSILSFTIYSCTKEQVKSNVGNQLKTVSTGDPTIGYNMTFHPNGEPSDPVGLFGIRLWEGGNWDNSSSWSSGRRRKYMDNPGMCQFIGVCGDQGPIIQPNDPNFPLVGREVKMVLTQSDITLGSKLLYFTQSIADLDPDYRTMYINNDFPLEGSSYLIKAGEYIYNPNIGQFGGYQLNIAHN